jgi:hypothetical protein
MDWELGEHQRENGLANLVSDGEAAENRRMDQELGQYLRDNGLAWLVSDEAEEDGAVSEGLSEDFL